MPIETLIRALTGQTARPYYMPPGLLGVGGNVPEGAHVSDSGEVINPETWQPYPEVRRPGGALPLTRGPDGEPIAAMPKGLETLGLMLGGRGSVSAPVSRAPSSRVAEALSEPQMKLAPYRKQLGPDSYGGRIYRGDDYIGWTDTSSAMPGKVRVDYIGAGAKENPTAHFENSMTPIETRQILRQLKQYWQAQSPEEKLRIGGFRIGGARAKHGKTGEMEVPFKPVLGGAVAGPSLLELLRGGDRRQEQGL